MEEGLAEVLAEEHMGPWIRNVATKTDVAMIRKDLEDAQANIRRDVATKADVAMIRKDAENTQAMIRKDLENAEANIRRDVATKTDVAMIRKDLEDAEANIRRDVATKADVAMIRKDSENTQAMIRKDLEHTRAMIRADVEKRIAELRADLIKWMFGAVMAQVALVVALIKLLPQARASRTRTPSRPRGRSSRERWAAVPREVRSAASLTVRWRGTADLQVGSAMDGAPPVRVSPYRAMPVWRPAVPGLPDVSR